MEIPMILGEPADKWYTKFIRDMKKAGGDHWLDRLTKEEQRLVLKAHQAATVAIIARGRRPRKPKPEVIPQFDPFA